MSEQEESTPVQEVVQSKWLQEWNDECDKILAEDNARAKALGSDWDTAGEQA